jgi:ABC-type transport system involved in cytochrome c biogenesis ATPase subunit
MKITVSKSFDTRVEKSERVLEVAEAFGLGLTDKKFVVYEGLEMDIQAGDVVYVNGQSGSGKSLLLRDMAEQFRAAGLHVYDIADVPLLDKPLVDQIGRSTEEALSLLSKAGLNDAYLFIRKPCELSDGQKYRFKLAKLIESGAQVWIADEFAAVLDRDTAKVVAHNVAKTARSASAILLVATTHVDLREYLGASVTVEKLYGTRVQVTRLAWSLDGERIELPPEPEKPAKPVKEPKPKKEPKVKKEKPVPYYFARGADMNVIWRQFGNHDGSEMFGEAEAGYMKDGKWRKKREAKNGTVASNPS